MKLWFKNRPETEETPDQPLERTLAEAKALTAGRGEEAAARAEERQWYLDRLVGLWEEGDAGEIRAAAVEMLQQSPTSAPLRLMAAAAYMHIGDVPEGVAQLGIALALDPTFYPAHRRLAAALLMRGERDAALRALETGWEHRRRRLARKDLAREHEEWFRLMYAEVPPAPARDN